MVVTVIRDTFVCGTLHSYCLRILTAHFCTVNFLIFLSIIFFFFIFLVALLLSFACIKNFLMRAYLFLSASCCPKFGTKLKDWMIKMIFEDISVITDKKINISVCPNLQMRFDIQDIIKRIFETKLRYLKPSVTSSSAIAERPRCRLGQFWPKWKTIFCTATTRG